MIRDLWRALLYRLRLRPLRIKKEMGGIWISEELLADDEALSEVLRWHRGKALEGDGE